MQEGSDARPIRFGRKSPGFGSAGRPAPERTSVDGGMHFDWRDTFSHAADLALLGILLTVAMLPVVTAGSAVGTASAAIHEWLPAQRWPTARATLGRFYRGLLPGLGATVVTVALGALVAWNWSLLVGGHVPGGVPVLVATGLVAVLATGVAALAAVRVGQTRGGSGSGGWRAALRWAARSAFDRPAVALALAGIVALAALLSVLMPLCAPIAAGYAFFALHVVTRRLLPG